MEPISYSLCPKINAILEVFFCDSAILELGGETKVDMKWQKYPYVQPLHVIIA